MLDVESATQLRGVVMRIARRLNASATSEGLTPTQASVLGLIAARGPLGLAQLAELEGLNPTMLSRVIGALTSAGLIVRTPDPADLRPVADAVKLVGVPLGVNGTAELVGSHVAGAVVCGAQPPGARRPADVPGVR